MEGNAGVGEETYGHERSRTRKIVKKKRERTSREWRMEEQLGVERDRDLYIVDKGEKLVQCNLIDERY